MTQKRFRVFNHDEYDYELDYITDNGKQMHIEDVCDLLNQLHEENIKLKKVIEENEKLIQSTYDELTKLRCIKENLGRIKSQWDWIMEAIQYD